MVGDSGPGLGLRPVVLRVRAQGSKTLLSRNRRAVMEVRSTQQRRSQPPNQPMERTPPCCALRRRSSARWASAWKQGVRCSVAAGNLESHVLRVSTSKIPACWRRARRLWRRVAHVRRWVIQEKLPWVRQAHEYRHHRPHGPGALQLQAPYSCSSETQGPCIA